MYFRNLYSSMFPNYPKKWSFPLSVSFPIPSLISSHFSSSLGPPIPDPPCSPTAIYFLFLSEPFYTSNTLSDVNLSRASVVLRTAAVHHWQQLIPIHKWLHITVAFMGLGYLIQDDYFLILSLLPVNFMTPFFFEWLSHTTLCKYISKEYIHSFIVGQHWLLSTSGYYE